MTHNKQPNARYIVETEMLFGWEPCWVQPRLVAGTLETFEQVPTTFATLEEAVQEIRYYIADCAEAGGAGDMVDSPDLRNFRIIHGQDVYTFTGQPWTYEKEAAHVSINQPKTKGE